jgi:hypothetical protein
VNCGSNESGLQCLFLCEEGASLDFACFNVCMISECVRVQAFEERVEGHEGRAEACEGSDCK